MKKDIRREILRTRQALKKEVIKKNSTIICENFNKQERFKNAHTIMAYLPFRNEVDVTQLFHLLWVQGKRVVIPVCDVENNVLIPSELKNMEDLHPGPWNILEPEPKCLRSVNVQEIDFVIVPGVAFDYQCNRLGYGGGYYDRFLPRLNSKTLKVAAAFNFQIVEELCPEKFDVPMDMVITEKCDYYRVN